MRLRDMFDERHEVLGWLGMLCILAAYAALNLRQLSTDNGMYFFLNIVGSALLVYSSLKVRNYPLVALNGVWIAISLLGFITG